MQMNTSLTDTTHTLQFLAIAVSRSTVCISLSSHWPHYFFSMLKSRWAPSGEDEAPKPTTAEAKSAPGQQEAAAPAQAAPAPPVGLHVPYSARSLLKQCIQGRRRVLRSSLQRPLHRPVRPNRQHRRPLLRRRYNANQSACSGAEQHSRRRSS